MSDNDYADLRALIEKVAEAVVYSYQAGEYPDDLDPKVEEWMAGDGGLLQSLNLNLALLADLDAAQEAYQKIRPGYLAAIQEAGERIALAIEARSASRMIDARDEGWEGTGYFDGLGDAARIARETP